MNQMYPTLLSPVCAGKNILKSRMVYPNASPHTLQGPESFPADGFRKFYSDLAKNGAGIVTIAEWSNPNQRFGPIDLDATHMQSFDLKDPSVHNYFSLLAEEIHFYGSKLLLCAEVDWPDGFSLTGGRRPGPPIPGKGFAEDQAIAKEEIPGVIENFVRKMKMYKTLGYDGMTIRCDLQILPKEKNRDDEYGGDSIENRSRFIREVYAAVKAELGPDFITEAQIAWQQPYGYGPMSFGGVNSDQVMEFCKLIDKDVDIFQIRESDGCRSHPTGFNFKQGEHPALDFAVRMRKEGITALLEPIGGFQEPDEMEAALAAGKCDLFGMARAFMADSCYLEKIRQNKAEEITPCLKCNKCHGVKLPEPAPWITMCSVNPRHGLEHELGKLVAESKPKKVAVIGGGPAGMRAAIVAAERGHEVTLYEKSDVLGGQLLHADYFDFKWPIKNYLEWLKREVTRVGVTVKMNTLVEKEQLLAEGYEAVIAATGAVPYIPASIPGAFTAEGKANYLHVDDVWGKEKELGHHVIIIGGSETGMETAIYLLRAGHEVTMLTRQKHVAHDASGLHYITTSFVKVFPDGRSKEAAEWERYDDFHGITEARVMRLEGNQVTFANRDGAEETITADDILICGGHKELREEALAYGDGRYEFYAIGACNGCGNLQECNREAFARASIL